jgi:hypothetical protein
MRPITFAILLCSMSAAAAPPAPAPGRWAANDNVSMSGSAKAGAKFFLDVVLAKDGAFQGSWEEYVCMSYPGAYGINILACQRSKRPSAASGRFDLNSGAGQIKLERLGETSCRFRLSSNAKGQPQLEIELPREWLKQGDAVLYETSLNPR